MPAANNVIDFVAFKQKKEDSVYAARREKLDVLHKQVFGHSPYDHKPDFETMLKPDDEQIDVVFGPDEIGY